MKFPILVTIFALLLCLTAVAQSRKPKGSISAGILNGKAISLPKPPYPEDARKSRLSGKVEVQVLIDENGKVISANAISGLENVSLRLAAEAAALKATFSPTKLRGEPVKVSGVIVYNFVAEKSNEEKLRIMGLSMFLTTMRGFVSDLDKFNTAFEAKDLLKETIPDYPEFSSDLANLTTLEKLPVDKRIEAIDKTSSSIRSKLSQSEAWQFDVGKNFGEMLAPIMLLSASDGEITDLNKFETDIKLCLNKIKDLTFSAPSDFPKDVMEKLKILVAEGEKDTLLTPENLKEFSNKMIDLFETISPGSTK
jgi:TonB family protein